MLVLSWDHEPLRKIIDPIYTLAGEDVIPVFTIIAAETTFFVLASISFMAGIGAPKDIHSFCLDNLTYGEKFVECDANGIP
jgi:hypothetical protein